MFIINWLRPNNTYYYKYSQYFHFYQNIGYQNQYGHEIIDINFIYNVKVWSYNEYFERICFKTELGLKGLLKSLLDK